MNYIVAVIYKNEVIDPGIFVNASSPTDACKKVENMSTDYYLPKEKLLLARTHSRIIDWLLSMEGLNVRLIKDMFTYEGILRATTLGGHWTGLWEVRFHEFLPSEISSYGYDQNDVAYIVLTGD